MDFLKVVSIAALALVSTWAAGQVTARWATPPSLGLVEALAATDGAGSGAAPAGATVPPAPPVPAAPATVPAQDPGASPPAGEPPLDDDPRRAGKGKPTAAIEEVSDEEVDAAIRDAEKALSGDKAPQKTPGEFRPSRPLPADTAIALPSDI